MYTYKCIILKKLFVTMQTQRILRHHPYPLTTKTRKGGKTYHFLIENTRSFYHERKSHGAYFDYLNL